jgi:hypothetical protein
LVHIIRGTHKGHLESVLLNQLATLDITRLNRYLVRAPVDKVESHFIQSAWGNIEEFYYLHGFASAAERLEFIDSLLADTKYLFPIAECVEGGAAG